MHHGAAVVGEGCDIALVLRLQQASVAWKLVVRQRHLDVMDPVKRLVQQGEREQLPGPGVRHDAACGASRGVAAQADVLDVFPPALEVSRDDAG